MSEAPPVPGPPQRPPRGERASIAEERLDHLADAPVSAHIPVLEDLHRELTEALRMSDDGA